MPVSVEDTLTRLAAAWNDGDAAAYAGLFTEDATYVVFDGTVVRGRAALEEGHRALFAGPLKGFRMDPPTIAVPVRYLGGGDVARVLAAGGPRPPGQAAVPGDRPRRDRGARRRCPRGGPPGAVRRPVEGLPDGPADDGRPGPVPGRRRRRPRAGDGRHPAAGPRGAARRPLVGGVVRAGARGR